MTVPPPYSPFGNGAFEIAVIERMVFDLDREPLVTRIERRTFGDRPGFEDAVELEPQIVMQPRRVVLLDHKAKMLGGRELTSPVGSAVFVKSRFSRYVLSFFNATAKTSIRSAPRGNPRNKNPSSRWG